MLLPAEKENNYIVDSLCSKLIILKQILKVQNCRESFRYSSELALLTEKSLHERHSANDPFFLREALDQE